MIQGMDRATDYRLRDEMIFVEEEAGSLFAQIRLLKGVVASTNAFDREEVKEHISVLQLSALQLTNRLNSLQLEIPK